jgi:C1A family cysteine protease
MPNPQGFFTGHVRSPIKDHLMAMSASRHRALLRQWEKVTLPPSWDSRTLGVIGPIKDQGQCGSCWDFSGTFVVETAHYLAGTLKADGSDALSEEYTLSCGNNGGCNGDDNVTVLQWAKSTGLPRSSDYGSYTASPGTCKWKTGMSLYKVDDWGFVDGASGQGVTDTDKIKAAIMQRKCVGCAVDASFSDPGTGIISGNGSSIDHDVGLFGWQDTGTAVSASVHPRGGKIVAATGWWWMRNSWGIVWGDQGFAKIAYGAYSIGTEAVWAYVNPVNPPIDWYS